MPYQNKTGTSSIYITNPDLIIHMVQITQATASACNFWTMLLTLTVIYRLGKEVYIKRNNKSPLAVHRQKLYISSMCFVSLIFVLSMIDELCILFHFNDKFTDFVMELYTFVATYIFFW